MGKQETILNPHCLIEEASDKRLHIVWFKLCNSLEKTKNYWDYKILIIARNLEEMIKNGKHRRIFRKVRWFFVIL